MAAKLQHLMVQLILYCLLTVVSVEAQNTNFSFPYFSEENQSRFLRVGDTQYYAEKFTFLMNERAAALGTESCGRLLYKDKVRMKDSAGVVASFHTAFTFQITGINYWVDGNGFPLHGDGLAFTFASNSSFTGQEGIGGSLCLFKAGANGEAFNRVFAVEFDTFVNEGFNDSSDSHIGIDINSMNSKWSHNLCGGRVWNCSYLANGGFFTAWIDYDSGSENMQVFFANGSLYNSIPKPPKPVINASLASAGVRLAEIVDDEMFVGFSSSTGSFFEVHHIQSWAFSSSGMPSLPPVQSPPGDKRSRKVGVIVGVSVGAVVAVLLLVVFIARCCWRRVSHKKQDKFSLVEQNLVPRTFTYRELSKATKNFNRSELLGSGGFGSVYKGTLPSGALVAVKRVRHESKHGEESFLAEAASLCQIRHRNLVQLRGWCQEEEQLFLVCDYMCNGSLDEWLYHRRRNRSNEVEALPLGLRYSVLSGVAAALAYLHEECVQCVLHRDIKSSNVLLDGDLNAYLGDFGLARLIDHQKMEKTTMMAGTLGYMAPEMPHTGKATRESDVYSFGVLMLEVMCGMRPLDMAGIERGDGILVDRVWRAHEAGNVLQVADPRLGTFPLSHSNSGGFDSQDASHIPIHASDVIMEDKKLIRDLLHLGLLCCNPNPEDRPSTRLVSQILQSSETMEMSMPPLPACKPHAIHSRPGFSQFVVAPSSDSSALSSGSINIQEATVQQSSAPSKLQPSFVASSAVFSGR